MTSSQLAGSSGNTILVVDDSLDISSTLRSCNFPVRAVSLNDPHVRHEVLANVVEGTIMGAIVCLKGPAASARAANMANARDNNRKAMGSRDQGTRTKAIEHAFLLELMMTIHACDGFLVLTASARNVI